MAQQQAILDQSCRMIDEAELSVLNSCRRAKGAEYRHGDRRGCLGGTRETVLSEIESWAKGFDVSSVFWLNGLAGTGKSTIAQTIAERIFAEDLLGASFFCSRDFEDRSNLRFIFPTIAFQLAHKYSDFRSHLVSLLRSDPDVFYESLCSQMQKLIAEPLQITGVSTVIVIDALDECKDHEPSSAILSVLGRFVKQIPGVKFFITGRPEPRIETGFRLPLLVNSTDVFVLHNVHASLINSDIRLFLEHELSELSRRRGLEGWPSDEHIDILCRRAAGLFVYAVATVKFLDGKVQFPRDRLSVILKLPESTAPEGKTCFNQKTTLDSLYMSILQAAFDEEDPDTDSKARNIIGTIVLLVNSLPPPAIAELIGLKSEEVTLFLAQIQSLLAMGEDPSQPVKPFHKSFPEFITDSSRCTNTRFYVSPKPLHLELATNCLRLMNVELEQDLLSLPDYALNSEVEDLQARIDDRVSIALQYACRSWHSHLTEARGDVSDVINQLKVLLEEKFLAWLEVLSALGDVRGAVVGLEELAPWLQEVAEDSHLQHMAKDYLNFVTKFFEPINISATHIYHSALELCPMSSDVRGRYYDSCRRITQLPRVVVGTQDRWDPTVSVSSKGGEYKSCSWSPCGRFVAAQMESIVEVRNQLTFELLTVLQPTEPTHQLTGPLAYSPDGRSIACASDTSIVIWDIQTGGVAKELDCGTKNLSMVWSLDGKSICTIGDDKNAFSVRTHNVAARTTSSPENLRSDDNPHLSAYETSFRVVTTARSYFRGTIEVFAVGHTLVKIHSFNLTWRGPTSHLEICFSPTTCRIAVLCHSVLHVFGNWNPSRLLQEGPGHFSSQFFSSDGILFGAFDGRSFHGWKYDSDRYYPWRRFEYQDWTNPTFQFSPNSSSVLEHFGRILRVWNLEDDLIPDPFEITCAVIPRSGNHILTATPYKSIVEIVDPHSKTPCQTIKTGETVYTLALTGNVLLVSSGVRVVAWLLTDEGLVDGVSSGSIAGPRDSIWTTPIAPFDKVLMIGNQVGAFKTEEHVGGRGFKMEERALFVYHTETGELLQHQSVPKHFSGYWNFDRVLLRGRDHLRCHNISPSNTSLEGTSQITLQEGWAKDPEGRHMLWIPAEWRKSWHCADWLHDARIQFSVIGRGRKPVIVKF
ncbi:hypothetical protein BJ322DRAFT_850627 [Thelephora terrestris]|uniref:NACHT domain-containing protein n=1 Tax=Thelephora terrestris TaxID=56493 RepID=A0A9P6HDE2_9AGAM|nr:hypothetical protein BJ322DRAFT_850627 [Thelephora terrestris]